jgi:hypothetical protein
MNAQELKNLLSEDQIITILSVLGSDLVDRNNKDLIFTTFACHGGDSHKLYFNLEHKSFMCYTNCGQIGGILDLVMLNKGFELYEAITYVCNLLNIPLIKQGFAPEISVKPIDDWTFINEFKRRKAPKTVLKSEFYDESILNIFQEIYTSEWLSEGITKDVMKYFEIKYCTLKQSIIIPHRDVDGGLVGIRQRNLLDSSIEEFGKYCPFYLHRVSYKHNLGEHFYGLYQNKECIKRVKKVMLVEGEKSVQQAASLFGIDNNFTLALCGSNLTKNQKDILISLGVEEVIIALDKQYMEIGTEEYNLWIKHIKEKFIQPLVPYFKVYVILDQNNLLDYKESPLDKSREVLLKLMQEKIYVTS